VLLIGKTEARGLYGGSVSATSSGGGVAIIEGDIRIYGESGSAGSVFLGAPNGVVQIEGSVIANGGAPGGGGDITIAAGGGVDIFEGHLRARGTETGSGGSIDITAGGSVSFAHLSIDLRAFGSGSGGSLDVTSISGEITFDSRIDAGSQSGAGGSVNVDGAGNVAIPGPVIVSGATNGGEARFSSGAFLELGINKNYRFEAEGATGGVIEASAAGAMSIEGQFSAATGGCIAFIEPPAPVIIAGSTFDPPYQATACP
jgi:hypothetical protein